MYFIILIFFLNGLPFFFAHLTKISLLSVPITAASEILMTRMKRRTLSACLPGLLLPCSFLIACGLSMEIVFSLGSRQRDSHSRGQRRAASLALPAGCAATAGFHSRRVAPEEGRVLILIPILTTQLALSSSPQADSPTAMALPPAESEAGFGPKSKISPMCHTS